MKTAHQSCISCSKAITIGPGHLPGYWCNLLQSHTAGLIVRHVLLQGDGPALPLHCMKRCSRERGYETDSDEEGDSEFDDEDDADYGDNEM